ncbi:MAG: TolB-like translocation protein [Minisyncoccota bacterium]
MTHIRHRFSSKKVLTIGGVLALFAIGGLLVVRPHDITHLSYVEKGNLYASDLSGHTHVIASGVSQLVGASVSGDTLYLAARPADESMRGGTGNIPGTDLTILDPKTGQNRVIAKNIWTAHLSPDGSRIVAADSDNKVHLFDLQGNEKARIGNNGSNPIFSSDGKYVVYQKLADTGRDFFDLSSNAKGLALYDISTEQERMLTNNSGDNSPIGFSANGKYFYFTAGRPYESSVFGITNIVYSLYSLDMNTGIVRRLTNVDERQATVGGPILSFISQDALWTADRLKAIADEGHGNIQEFIFDGKGGLVSVEHIADGDSPRWVEQDKTFAVRVTTNGNEHWQVMNVK